MIDKMVDSGLLFKARLQVIIQDEYGEFRGNAFKEGFTQDCKHFKID